MRNRNGWPRALGVAAAVLFVLGLGCGEETETYEAANWRVGATFGGNTVPLAAEAFTDGACYVAGVEYWNELDEMRGVIYRFERGRLELAFRAPDTHSEFICMGAAPDSIWAGGYYHLDDAGKLDPYLVRYDGAAFTEVACPGVPGLGGIRAIAPVSKNAAWVAIDGGEVPTLYIYYYENGTWRACLDGLPEIWEINLVATPSGKAFVNCFTEPPHSSEVVILCSDDKGATWHREAIDFGLGFRGFSRPILATSGETLYVAATFTQGEPPQNVLFIMRRDAAPAGQGTYVTDYFTFDTSDTLEVGPLTVGANGNGYAVGRGIGYRRREGGWTPQDFSAMPSLVMWDVTGGAGGFWALGEYVGGGGSCRLFVSP